MLELIGFALRNWLTILVGALVGGVVFGGTALLQEPVYRAEVILSPALSDSGSGLAALGALSSVASMAGIDLGGNAQQRREAMAILSSRQLAMQFINEKNLLPLLFEEDWDHTNDQWISNDPEEVPSISDGIERLLNDVVRVVEDNHTGLVSVTVDWKTPGDAAEWANDYVALANGVIRSRVIAEGEASIRYLRAELGRVESIELKQAIFSLMEVHLKEQMMASVREEYAFRVIDPAVAGDVDDPYKPNVVLSSLAGLLLGFLLGLIAARDLEARKGAGSVLQS